MSATNGFAGGETMVSEPSKNGFQSFENAAADAVLAICYNFSGKRMATASADHKIRIYDTGDQDVNAQPTLIDRWRAHDAEILDVQWIPGPFTSHFATTAADNKIKIWREDPSQAPLSGRRFRCIFSASPASHVAYTSFSFHALSTDLYLALFTHDGLFSLLEPSEPDSLSSWREIDQFYPFGRFARGTEPRFCLSFSQTPHPTPLPQGTLSLAASAFSLIKIYRALPLSSSSGSDSDPASTQDPSGTTATNNKIYPLTEYLELDLPGSPEINHLSWSPGCLTPWDVIAAACDDGTVRIVDILVPPSSSPSSTSTGGVREATLPSRSADPFTSSLSQGLGGERERERYAAGRGASNPSGITTGLAGLSTQPPHSNNISEGIRQNGASSSSFKHAWRQSGILRHSHGRGGGACWKAKWVFDGSAVASVGDDGEVALWRRGIAGVGEGDEEEEEEGEWLEWSRTRYEG